MHTFPAHIDFDKRFVCNTVQYSLHSFALGCNRSHDTISTEKHMLVVLQFRRLAVGHLDTMEAQRCRVQQRASAKVPHICSFSVSIGITVSVKAGVGALLKTQKMPLIKTKKNKKTKNKKIKVRYQ